MGNTFKTAFLLTLMTLLLMFIGRAFGGQNGMFIALAFAVVMNFVSYFYSDKIALAMYRAQPVAREQLPRAYEMSSASRRKSAFPCPRST
jgi:heat shock protein HtpX